MANEPEKKPTTPPRHPADKKERLARDTYSAGGFEALKPKDEPKVAEEKPVEETPTAPKTEDGK
jgi:hypothetical protein